MGNADPRFPEEGFATTRWSVILEAKGEGEGAKRALEDLCRSWWYPLYAFARRRGARSTEAEDQVQGFFSRFLESGHVATVDPEKGRLRSWLLAAFTHHLANEAAARSAARRGGGANVLRLDLVDAEKRLAREPEGAETPERQFERAYARALVDKAKEALRAECAGTQQGAILDRLGLDPSQRPKDADPRKVAEELGMTEGALRVALHRLRARFAVRLRAEVRETLAAGMDLEDELRDLLRALGPD